jgi:serine/threonine protein kinase
MENLHTDTCKHLKGAKFVVKLGQGILGAVKLYQCKDFHRNDIICNELMVVKNFYDESKPLQLTKRREMLLNEYSIGCLLDHEHIIKTHGMNIHQGFLVLEHCPGEDLFDFFNRKENIKRRDMTVFAPLYLQILEAVSYLHGIGIAHIDLKLENIMLDLATNRIKLIDFGHSDFFIRNNKRVALTEAKGTVEYLPPEMLLDKLSGKYVYGDQIDIWSMGVVLYSFVFNRSLWACANSTDSVFKRCNEFFKEKQLHPTIFKSPKLVGYDDHDSLVIEKLFLMIFCERVESIVPILQQYKTLRALKSGNE